MALQLHINPHPDFYARDEIQVAGYSLPPPGLVPEEPISDLGLDLITPGLTVGSGRPASDAFFTTLVNFISLPPLEPTDGYVHPPSEPRVVRESSRQEHSPQSGDTITSALFRDDLVQAPLWSSSSPIFQPAELAASSSDAPDETRIFQFEAIPEANHGSAHTSHH